MEKEDTKKKVTKTVKRVKKDTEKKVKELNETVKNNVNEGIKDVKEVVVNEALDLTDKQKCKYCGKYFDKGMTICPNCRRRNKNNSFDLMFFVIIGVVFFLCIMIFYFIDSKIINNVTYESYTQSCTLVSYEDMVRVPKKYLEKDVAVVGRVKEVTGYSDGLYNSMSIVLDLNLFDDDNESLITVDFDDKTFEQGFIDGDIVKVYGEYIRINGNTPLIEAKYINLNN